VPERLREATGPGERRAHQAASGCYLDGYRKGITVFYVFLFIGIAVLLGIIPLAIVHDRNVRNNWRQAAETLGLTFHGRQLLEGRRIEGVLHGFLVRIDTYTQKSGKNSKTYTRLRMQYPRPLGLGLKLTREGFFSSLTKLLGAQDITLGDDAFDRTALVKGADPERVRAFLTPARRVRIHQLLKSYPEIEVNDREILLRRHGVIRDAKTLVAVVRSMQRVAWHLTGDREEDEAMTAAMEAQDAGRPDEALRILRESEARATAGSSEADRAAVHAPFVDEHLLEGEILQMAGRQEEAAERFELARQESPNDLEIQRWAGRAAEETQDDAESHSQSSTPEPAAGPPMDVAGFCQTVFGDRNSSFTANEFFEQNYAGKDIHWSGLLRRVERISFDMVFGDQEACRATVELHTMGESSYWSSPIKAFVQLPSEAGGSLRDQIGQSVTFTGRLLKLDAFMRNVYVADAAMKS
jgi:hypothetical protein